MTGPPGPEGTIKPNIAETAAENGAGGGRAAGASGPQDASGDHAAPDPDAGRGRRPMIERVGLFLIALVLAGLFAGIAAALVAGGELFLGVMAAIGCAMTVWVGGLTLVRG